jgi:predicted DNA-binding transcriptional regulator YafY
LPEDAFAHSLGVNQGAPEKIEVVFAPKIARYIRERVWHPSQEMVDRPDGSLHLTLNVVNDWALKSWILGFGALAVVASPPGLASELAAELKAAADRYPGQA